MVDQPLVGEGQCSQSHPTDRLASPFMGRLADRYGSRSIFISQKTTLPTYIRTSPLFPLHLMLQRADSALTLFPLHLMLQRADSALTSPRGGSPSHHQVEEKKWAESFEH